MDKTKAFEVGAADYVAKPFQWAEVQTRVKTQLALRQLQLQTSALNVAAFQPALWAKSMPEIAPFNFAAQSSPSNAHLELLDWQRSQHSSSVHLTLARLNANAASSLVLLATIRGLFKGLGFEQSLQERFHRAQALIAPDLLNAPETLWLLHGELKEGDCTFTYLDEGYTLALVRQQTVIIQAAEATIVFEPGDRLFIFSADLQSANAQLTEILMNCNQPGAESSFSAAILGQIADQLRSAIAYEGSVMMLHCLP